MRFWRAITRRLTDRLTHGLEINLTTMAQIESLGQFRLPPSATIREAHAHAGIQTHFSAVIELSPADLDTLRDGSLIREFTAEYRPKRLVSANPRLMRSYVGGEGTRGTVSQCILVDISDRERYIAHIDTCHS